MYKFLIKEYQTKPFGSYLFNLALTYHVKKRDFNTVKEIIEKTNWKTEENYYILKTCALFECSLDKKPSYKLFNFLFSRVIYKDPPENFNYKITGEDIKKYDLHKVIENCISNNKISFLNKLLKDYSNFDLIEYTLKECIKLHKNDLAQEYYKLHKCPSLHEDIISNSVKYKNISMLEYIAKESNIFNRYASWKAEKSPDFPEEHYYTYHKRYLELMEIRNSVTDEIIIKHITSKDFSTCLKNLLNENRNKTASEWLDKLKKNKLSFELKDIDVLRDIRVNIEKLSLKSLLIYYNLAKDKRVFEDSLLLADYRYANNINNKILNAISHNKMEYLNRIKSEFKLKKILYNSFLIDSYYTQMSPNSIKLEHELEPLSLEKKINLCLSNKENTYLTCILKEHPWEEINKHLNDNKVHSTNTQYILYHYMNSKLDSKVATKKIKI